jgi:hypothetical protein
MQRPLPLLALPCALVLRGSFASFGLATLRLLALLLLTLLVLLAYLAAAIVRGVPEIVLHWVLRSAAVIVRCGHGGSPDSKPSVVSPRVQ